MGFYVCFLEYGFIGAMYNMDYQLMKKSEIWRINRYWKWQVAIQSLHIGLVILMDQQEYEEYNMEIESYIVEIKVKHWKLPKQLLVMAQI